MKSRFLNHFSWISLTVYAGMFVYIAVRHISYPGFTEPMEGDVLQHILRILNGLAPYPRPEGEFIALAHMPLYYFVAAPFYLIFGDSFAGPRLLSSLCAVISGGLLGWIAWKESRSRAIAFLAAAIYFSGYRIMDAYLTCALSDSLMLLFLLLGFCFFSYGTNWLHDALWLILFSLAFWTKQHAAFYFGFAVLYALFFRKNYLPRWAIVLGILLGGPISYILAGSYLGDAFFYHTFVVPGRWEHKLWFSLRRTAFVLLCFVPFSSLLTLPYLKQSIRLRELKISPLGWFVVTALFSAAITMTAAGSSNNHYIPFIASLSATAALGFHVLISSKEPPGLTGWIAITAFLSIAVSVVAMRKYAGMHPLPFFSPFVVTSVLIVYAILANLKFADHTRKLAVGTLLVIGQFGVAFYYPPNFLPEPGYKEGITRVRTELAKLDGPVIWLTYGHVPFSLVRMKMAKAPSWVALQDIERQVVKENEIEKALSPFRDRISTAKKLYLLANDPLEEAPGWSSVATNFALIKDFGTELSALRQVTYHWYGGGGYPRFLYLTRSALQTSTGRDKQFQKDEYLYSSYSHHQIEIAYKFITDFSKTWLMWPK